MVEQNEIKPVSQMVGPNRGSPFLFVLSVLLLILAVAGGFYLNLSKSALEDEQKRIDGENATLDTEITALRAQNVQGAQLAQSWLDEIKIQEINWSGVIEAIELLLPKDEKTGLPVVNILSYSGTEGGKVNLSVESKAQSEGTFENVARLISAFNSNTLFSNAVVPSIARGESEEGDVLLSFVLNVKYLLPKNNN